MEVTDDLSEKKKEIEEREREREREKEREREIRRDAMTALIKINLIFTH